MAFFLHLFRAVATAVLILNLFLIQAADFKSCKAMIIRAFERGLTNQTLALHGTSIEAVERGLKTGSLGSGLAMNDERQLTLGHFYFFPIQGRTGPSVASPDYLNYASAVREAGRYAEEKARQHYFLKEFGLSFDDPKIYHNAHRLLNDTAQSGDARIFFVDYGLQPRAIDRVSREANKRRGVLLGLSSDLATHRWLSGDMEGDRKIKVPDLKLRLISGIEPMGDFEYTFFEDLQNGVHDPQFGQSLSY